MDLATAPDVFVSCEEKKLKCDLQFVQVGNYNVKKEAWVI